MMKWNDVEVIIYDDYNSKVKHDSIIGTITPNCGVPTLRNGIKLIIKKKHQATLIRVGNIYGFTGGSFAGLVFAPGGLAPTINTAGGGNRMPIILECQKHD